MNVAAIDIGGTNTRVALVDEHYRIKERKQFLTDKRAERTLRQIRESILRFKEPVSRIGVSSPGPLDLKEGIILDPGNLGESWDHLALVKELKQLLNLPVWLDNDANLACLAEAVLGEGKDYHYVQFLTISTGIGSGLCIEKKIYRGAHGFAHEIAEVPMWRNGPQVGKLYPGAIEAISSGTAITVRARNCGLAVKHAGDVALLAKEGQKEAMMIIDDALEYLANLIAGIYAFIDPDIVILGGSVALKIDFFIKEVERRVITKVIPEIKPFVRVVKTSLNEDSGLLGAACLALGKD